MAQIEIPDVDGPTAIFGSTDFLPAWDDIPEDFRRGWHHSNHPWCGIVSRWFHKGLDYKKEGLSPKDGVDKDKALAALGSLLRSWEPKHEHKTAGVAYLMSQWFDLPHQDTP